VFVFQGSVFIGLCLFLEALRGSVKKTKMEEKKEEKIEEKLVEEKDERIWNRNCNTQKTRSTRTY
jgi:hypothetical protein